MNGYPTKFIDNAVFCQFTIYGPYHTKSKGFLKKSAHRYTILVKKNCFDLFAHIRIALMNFRNLMCTAFLVNVVWFTSVRLAEISL